MANGIVRLDSVLGNIRSARYYVTATPTAINNGMLVQVDALLDASANRELYKAIAPAAITAQNVGVVTTPEVIYDESTTKTLADFTNAAGDNIRVSMPELHKYISISDDCIEALSDAPVVGSCLIIKAGQTVWDEIAFLSLDGTESLVGKIIAREVLNDAGTVMNVVQFIKVI